MTTAMIVSLSLSPEEVDLLTRRADADAVTIDAVLHGLIAELAPAASAQASPRIGAMISALRGDEALDDPDDRAEWEREQAEMRANVARWRAEQGR